MYIAPNLQGLLGHIRPQRPHGVSILPNFGYLATRETLRMMSSEGYPATLIHLSSTKHKSLSIKGQGTYILYCSILPLTTMLPTDLEVSVKASSDRFPCVDTRFEMGIHNTLSHLIHKQFPFTAGCGDLARLGRKFQQGLVNRQMAVGHHIGQDRASQARRQDHRETGNGSALLLGLE